MTQTKTMYLIGALLLLSIIVPFIYVGNLQTHIATKFKNTTGWFQLSQRKEVRENSTGYATKTKDVYQHRIDVYRDGCNDTRRSFKAHQNNSNIGETLNLLYEDNSKLIYCLLPKVGCTNWLKVWLVLLGVANSSQVNNIHHSKIHFGYRKGNVYPHLRKLNRTDQNKRLENYLEFIFVRHPFNRLLSAFRNKFELTDRWNVHFHQNYGTKIIRRYRTGANTMSRAQVAKLSKQVKFHEFVQYIIDSAGTSKVNSHWKPMYQLCSACDVNYDVIGKFENLQEDARYVLKRAGVDDIVSYPAFDTHVTNSSNTDLLRRYYSSISKENILKLYNIYKPDFTLFGYPFPGDYMQWSTTS
ncbi:carbohydrate sulfotransferase 11-like [Glandiceps talaboti]